LCTTSATKKKQPPTDKNMFPLAPGRIGSNFPKTVDRGVAGMANLSEALQIRGDGRGNVLRSALADLKTSASDMASR